MKDLDLIITTIALLILLTGFIKKYVETSYVSEPMIALVAGILIGPEITGWIQWNNWEKPYELLHEITRFTISLALISAALRLELHFLKSNYRPLMVILIGGMLLMSLISSLIYILGGLPLWESILIGAIITPTDPVLATTIVTGFYAKRNVPLYMRDSLTFESAANDGLAYPIVLIPLTFLFRDHPLQSWITRTVLWENVGAIVVGAISGYLTGAGFNYFSRIRSFEIKTKLAVTLALAFLMTSFLGIIKMNGIIGVFAAGLVFNMQVSRQDDETLEHIDSMLERLFVVPVFVLLGIMIPWEEWGNMPAILWIISPLALFLRRLPALYMLKPGIRYFSRRDTFFAGWFGPVGVAALFYATYAIKSFPEHQIVWPVVTYVVCLSTLIHGLTAFPLTRKFYAEK